MWEDAKVRVVRVVRTVWVCWGVSWDDGGELMRGLRVGVGVMRVMGVVGVNEGE